MEEASNTVQSRIQVTEEQLERVDRFRRLKETSVHVVMFTDMKGSAEIAERRGEHYAQQMRRLHNQILLEIIEKGKSGLCVKTIGDSVMAIFAEPSVAVERSLEIQRKLHGHNRDHPEEEPIVVRIGMHMGQVSIEDKTQMDVFGRHVNRAARVEALADGGHIYLTHGVYDSAHGWLKQEDLVWRNHGEYQVRGIAEPIRIYEVAEEDIVSLQAPGITRYVPPRSRLKIPAVVVATGLIVFTVMIGLSQRREMPMTPEQPDEDTEISLPSAPSALIESLMRCTRTQDLLEQLHRHEASGDLAVGNREDFHSPEGCYVAVADTEQVVAYLQFAGGRFYDLRSKREVRSLSEVFSGKTQIWMLDLSTLED